MRYAARRPDAARLIERRRLSPVESSNSNLMRRTRAHDLGQDIGRILVLDAQVVE
jgi:hypothetical protein